MNILVKLTFLFSTGSFIGWIIELNFRKWFSIHNPEHKWINPGFLVGPCLPLYGFGLCSLYLMAKIPLPAFSNEFLEKIVLFTAMAIAMTILEFIAGIIFIKGMHIKLWDYEKEKFNILGIICPKFSLYWAILSGAYYFLIHPRIVNSLNWLEDNMAFCLVIGFFYGVLSIDLIYTFNVVTKMRQFAIKYNILIRYESIKAEIKRYANDNKLKNRFLLAFSSERPLQEHLHRYASRLNSIKDKIEDKLSKGK